MRKLNNDLIPSNGGSLLKESNVRILWASWHILTVFGWGMAFILLWLARQSNKFTRDEYIVIVSAIAISMLVGAIFIFIGTKAKHPGWVGLLLVAIFVWLG
ncbi:hypothetical protein ABK040_011281 [Willaertia magna]